MVTDRNEPLQADPVAAELEGALRGWRDVADPAELRRALLRLLTTLG